MRIPGSALVGRCRPATARSTRLGEDLVARSRRSLRPASTRSDSARATRPETGARPRCSRSAFPRRRPPPAIDARRRLSPPASTVRDAAARDVSLTRARGARRFRARTPRLDAGAAATSRLRAAAISGRRGLRVRTGGRARVRRAPPPARGRRAWSSHSTLRAGTISTAGAWTEIAAIDDRRRRRRLASIDLRAVQPRRRAAARECERGRAAECALTRGPQTIRDARSRSPSRSTARAGRPVDRRPAARVA